MQFEASINYFFPKDLTDNVSDYGKVYPSISRKAFGLKGILVTRISQLATGVVTPPLRASGFRSTSRSRTGTGWTLRVMTPISTPSTTYPRAW